jgi:ubiquitin-associated SH3 domain-containing protein
MPHCTLTGFFEDELTAIPIYTKALENALSKSNFAIEILGITFKPKWHGLELYSPMLKQLIVNFAKTADSPTRKANLRLKDWLHLSLAYEFPPQQQDKLKTIAEEMINLQASVKWELRFYQQHSDGDWTCHQSWML